MSLKDYQKNTLMELMNMNEFMPNNKEVKLNPNPTKESKKIDTKKALVNPYEAKNINELYVILSNFITEKSIKISNKEFNIVEGNSNSKILFLYGYCEKDDNRIIDGEEGVLFDKMLKSINLNRKNIALISFIPRGLEAQKDNESVTQFNQLLIYKMIEILSPKYLIILGNYSIKMLLGSNLSSMSLRGKWFDFNTPNDTSPKKTRVLYEPRMLINNPDLKKDAWEDLKEIKDEIGG